MHPLKVLLMLKGLVFWFSLHKQPLSTMLTRLTLQNPQSAASTAGAAPTTGLPPLPLGMLRRPVFLNARVEYLAKDVEDKGGLRDIKKTLRSANAVSMDVRTDDPTAIPAALASLGAFYTQEAGLVAAERVQDHEKVQSVLRAAASVVEAGGPPKDPRVAEDAPALGVRRSVSFKKPAPRTVAKKPVYKLTRLGQERASSDESSSDEGERCGGPGDSQEGSPVP